MKIMGQKKHFSSHFKPPSIATINNMKAKPLPLNPTPGITDTTHQEAKRT
jgi:hypothetical protein